MNKQIQAIRREIKAKMSAKPPQKEGELPAPRARALGGWSPTQAGPALFTLVHPPPPFRAPLVPSRPAAARRLLTKMKGLEKQLHVISGYMTRLEQIKSGLDTADMQASMVSTLTKGADTIAATLKGRDLVEEMADASDKLEEGLDVLDEVGEIMADPAGRLDAGELDDELAEIMNEDNEELDEFEAAPAMPAAVPAPLPGLPEMSGLPAAPTSTALPAAPTTRHAPAAAAAAAGSSARAEEDEFADTLGMMG